MAVSITVANYLFTRLRQLGVKSIFGVPGDYNLVLLDYVEPSGLHWIGTCNELNGGYAVDGYAKINGIGAIITTFGVGELSAVNAIAGAYAELAPVVHIVGTPTRAAQDSRALVHHTLCDGEYGRFAKMHEQVTVAQVDLKDLKTIPAQIDWVLEQCLLRSRPVYIQLPDDIAPSMVDGSRLETAIKIPQGLTVNDEENIVQSILDRIYQAKKPAILVDGESRAYGILREVDQMIKGTGWPSFTTGFGKGLIDETLPNVQGIYQGSSNPKQKAYFDSADLVLNFGPQYSKTNSYLDSSIPMSTVTIKFGENKLEIDGKLYRDVSARDFVPRLIAKFDASKLTTTATRIEPGLQYNPEPEYDMSARPSDETALDQIYMWPMFQALLKPRDIVLCETGTAAYGARCLKLPPGGNFFTCATWLSIGYMLPAALGAAQARKEQFEKLQQKKIANETNLPTDEEKEISSSSPPRTFCFIGDGSIQMTIQEISTMIAQKLDITIIIINNDGYTVERCIHGRNQKYNDIAHWDYLQAPKLFSADAETEDYKIRTFRATTFGQLDRLIRDELDGKRGREHGFTMLEVVTQREDAPYLLRTLLDAQERGARLS